jgi:DeoR family glycerol-3-phosphate regulon repressor
MGSREKVLRERRWEQMLELLRANGSIAVDDLATRFGVSSMTIRRDLLELSSQGQLERVHGGALPPGGVRYVSADDRATQHIDRKRMIAAAAEQLISAEATVFLAGGTTVAEVAKLLVGRKLTVVTDSRLVIDALGSDESTELHVLGGRYRPETRTFVGPVTLEQMTLFRVEWAFLGASAVAGGDFFHYYPEDIPLQRAVIGIAAHAWLLVDASKLGAPAVGRVGSVDSLEGIITDASTPDREQVLGDSSVDLIVA